MKVIRLLKMYILVCVSLLEYGCIQLAPSNGSGVDLDEPREIKKNNPIPTIHNSSSFSPFADVHVPEGVVLDFGRPIKIKMEDPDYLLDDQSKVKVTLPNSEVLFDGTAEYLINYGLTVKVGIGVSALVIKLEEESDNQELITVKLFSLLGQNEVHYTVREAR